ncbi:MAG: hypothetical protein IJC19_02915 [Clostridia bacterium]|nr:hypothetical protein [Clostridia bacterium]
MNKMELAFFEEQYNSALSMRDKTLFKAGACLLIALLFTGLSLLNLQLTVNATLQLVAFVLIWGLCRAEMADGLRSFLRFSPTANSFHALALLATGGHGIYLLLSENPLCKNTFASVLFLSVALSMGMKYFYVLQIVKNLDMIRDKKTYALQVTDLSLSKKYIRQVCSANPLVDFPNVLRTSFDSDPVQKKNRKFAPILALCILGIAVVVAFFHDGMFLTALSALLMLCTSFGADLAFSLPYIFMQIRLRKLGSILLGNYSVEHLKETDTLLVKDTDLFPAENNEILNLRIRRPDLAEEAIRYTGALLKLSESPMKEVFFRLHPEAEEHAPTVLQWRVIKNYGIVATLNVDNVLFGNRNLMLSHNLRPWSPDREAMLAAAGVHMMYLAINGEIAATMIFRYGEDSELKKSAELLEGEFNLLVDTKDCNINESMIQRRYDLSRTKISVPDPDEAESVVETREEMEDDQSPPVMISTQNALGILESIRLAKQLDRSVSLSILIQQLSTVFGVILTTVALLFAPANLSWVWFLAFHLIWALPVPAIALFRKD